MPEQMQHIIRHMFTLLITIIGAILRIVMRITKWLSPIKCSVFAGAGVAFLGLLSMGALGIALFYAGWPILGPLYGNPDDFRGDWVWPAFLFTGISWGLAFPLAGWASLWLARNRIGVWAQRAAYALILWVSAILLWLLVMTFPPA
ncbi:MAG: hypothetical protein E2598_01040 [Sphingobium sp.]|nr:hypothetical protein [Sphingobium sp.]